MTTSGSGADRPTDGESGMTLVELLVAMLILSMVMGIVGTSIVSATASEVRVENRANTSNQITVAFDELDTEVRYATDISTPGTVAGNPVVQLESDWTNATTGTPQCTEIEYVSAAGVLKQRTWQQGGSVPSNWLVLATGLAVSPTTPPFSLSATGWQLTVVLSATGGKSFESSSSQSNFTITAVNVNTDSTSDPTKVCGGVPSS